MSDSHARRAHSPAASKRNRGGRAKHRLLLACVALPILAAAPAIWSVMSPPPSEGLQDVIREAGFDPLDPPSRLRGPGAIYEVDGNSYRKVCDADPTLLQGKLQTSPTQSHVLERLQSGGFTLKGEIVNALNASLGDSRVVSIEYGLTSVTISEIALSDLAQIQDKLLRDKSCDEEVTQLLRDNHKVCSGYAALSATAYYRVRVNSKLETDASSKPMIVAAQHALEEQTQGHVEVKGTNELTGENLYYGIQLADRCLTFDTDTTPSVLPPSSGGATPITPTGT